MWQMKCFPNLDLVYIISPSEGPADDEKGVADKNLKGGGTI